ncbi:MAG: aminomethyl-transferring glycine dehydrogenase subunit GcvPB, partial [Muribaculaceae bacterium]|nr:aminomethyl-transferring glycine dehydrogenase subunit GcvPB [Muribaculaceae bacterium]
MNRDFYSKLIFELSQPGRKGYKIPENHLPEVKLPENLKRTSKLELPEVDEPSVVRHYNNMSTNNFGVDSGFYPLGSCTMKYNPKINAEVAAHPAFTSVHPGT